MTEAMPNFQKYATVYDLLYKDKDYFAEADYVARALWSKRPAIRTILEFGSGTGRHGRILAKMGFDVRGIERSSEMASIALTATEPPHSRTGGSFTCDVGDLCTTNLGRGFDAVIALFHVMSYQTTDEALFSAFCGAEAHLVPGGLFIFDVWHAPAVLSQGVSTKVKEVDDDNYRVKRVARPEHDATRKIVKIVYEFECEYRNSREVVRFREEHFMRYLFPSEVRRFARSAGLRLIRAEELVTGSPPSPATWGVTYMLEKL
jgi:SAM-dependent methyltransferase